MRLISAFQFITLLRFLCILSPFFCSSCGFSDGNWGNKAGAAFGVRRSAARKYAAHVQWQQSKCSHFQVMNDNRNNISSSIFLTLKCQHSIYLIMAAGFLLEWLYFANLFKIIPAFEKCHHSIRGDDVKQAKELRNHPCNQINPELYLFYV